MMEVLANTAMVVITLQYISVSNQHVVLNLHKSICQLYLNKAGENRVKMMHLTLYHHNESS